MSTRSAHSSVKIMFYFRYSLHVYSDLLKVDRPASQRVPDCDEFCIDPISPLFRISDVFVRLCKNYINPSLSSGR